MLERQRSWHNSKGALQLVDSCIHLVDDSRGNNLLKQERSLNGVFVGMFRVSAMNRWTEQKVPAQGTKRGHCKQVGDLNAELLGATESRAGDFCS
ncbi:hypothetical protein, partial [Sinorhizobium meliloti]|uniref:hypothetical protein n=1 Tax=Rhizobium meliloti TaxID=382 RepID=UPI001A9E07A4